MGRVLIVEDDNAMSIALRDGLQYEGHTVMLATDGRTGLSLAKTENPDIVILDVMLPQMSGLDVCKQIRSEGNDVPIIMLTARGQEVDKVVGLKIGADDYVTKPFSFMELIARMEAVLRRQAKAEELGDRFRFGDVEVDFGALSACKSGRPLDLTPREFKLLRQFITNRGRVLSREKLLSAVWGYSVVPVTRTVDMHIAKLRKKIEDDPEEPAYVVTVHGVGYKFVA
jgi:two-component system alkaline phosphatase synthesis response regulator PhoP